MQIRFIAFALAASLFIAGGTFAQNDSEHVASKFSHEIPNIPGKSLVAVEVTYPPGGSSPPHRHAKSDFLYGYVLSGSIVSQVEGEPQKVYKAGESFFEVPGVHHVVARNASKTDPAKFLAVFVADSDDKNLTIPDK
jgi:quercetin dioxygenase-like cupin family protein